MLTLADILKPRHVDLAMAKAQAEQGFEELARRLEGDPGIGNWAGFHAALKLGGKPIGSQSILSHVRTDHVSTMLMAVGRMPVQSPGSGTPPDNSAENVHFLFLIAVAMGLAAEYLQMVGALARSLRNPATVAQLQETGSPQEFVRILCLEAAELRK